MRDKWNRYFISFLSISVLGWIYEVLLGIFVFHYGFVNRGFLFGPYCPVYGFGALLFLFLAYDKRNIALKIREINITPVIMFSFLTVVTTLVELMTSYLLEWTIGRWLWNYDGYFCNFEGRIALSTSLRFGIGGMFILYVLEPFIDKILDKTGVKNTKRITLIFGAIFLLDCILRIPFGSNFTDVTSY